MPPKRSALPLLCLIATNFFAANGGVARAADKPLSLDRALSQAISGNPDLQRERITIRRSDAQIQIAESPFDIRLTGDLTFSSSTTPSLTAQDLQGGSTDRQSFGLGLARQLETGGEISLQWSNSASDTNSRFACGQVMGAQQECKVFNTDLDLNFTHPILRGLGPEVTLANLRQTRIQKDQALLNRQMRASNIVRDVVNGYWNLAYATQNLEIQRSAVALAEEQLRVTKAQIDVGRLAPVDAASVERAIGQRRQEVIVAEQNLLFRTLELRALFGLPVDPNVAPYQAANEPEANPTEVDVAAEMEQALVSNPQLKQLDLGIKLREIDIKTARSTLLPQLDFLGSVGVTGRRSSFTDALEQAKDRDGFNWSAGLRFQMPIQNRAARGQMRAANLDIQLANIDADTWRKELQNQVVRLSSMVRTAGRRVELAKATVGFAQQDLEAEKARFSVGRSTNNDVLLRQQDLKDAEIQVVQATVDLLVGETSLAALSGALLDKYRIVLQGVDGN